MLTQFLYFKLRYVTRRLGISPGIDAIVEKYAKHDIHPDISTDGYKYGIHCYRLHVCYKDNNEWIEEDIGCYMKWSRAFHEFIKYAEFILKERSKK